MKLKIVTNNDNKQIAVILGAGPAGLTAAYELIKKTDIKPIIIEIEKDVGGLSKTVNHNGNLIDIGGHRFFSKSDEIMKWWQEILKIQNAPAIDEIILGKKVNYEVYSSSKTVHTKNDRFTGDPEKNDDVLLVRNRISRIYYLKKFFDYPVSISRKTVSSLGLLKMFLILTSYLKIKIGNYKKEQNLEELFINRFGKKLYEIFFKDYTEKVWGKRCDQIHSDWGHQRIKGLSIFRAIKHSVKKISRKLKKDDIFQKKVETSLIGKFLYPKFGPGQMWQKIADIIRKNGGEILLETKGTCINIIDNKCQSITVENISSGDVKQIFPSYLISSIAIKDLVNITKNIPEDVRSVANKLEYRDFITIGLLLKRMRIKNDTKYETINNSPPDNWIYIQEKDVKVCRVQIFNNWSPYMVKDFKNTVWIGLEYTCNEGDDFWLLNNDELKQFGIEEMEKINFLSKGDVLDSHVIKVKKAYPCYFGEGYGKLSVMKNYYNRIENDYLIGRNGMHRYNNQDHSMLTAIKTVECITNKDVSKVHIWDINSERQYHEEK